MITRLMDRTQVKLVVLRLKRDFLFHFLISCLFSILSVIFVQRRDESSVLASMLRMCNLTFKWVVSDSVHSDNRMREMRCVWHCLLECKAENIVIDSLCMSYQWVTCACEFVIRDGRELGRGKGGLNCSVRDYLSRRVCLDELELCQWRERIGFNELCSLHC